MMINGTGPVHEQTLLMINEPKIAFNSPSLLGSVQEKINRVEYSRNMVKEEEEV